MGSPDARDPDLDANGVLVNGAPQVDDSEKLSQRVAVSDEAGDGWAGTNVEMATRNMAHLIRLNPPPQVGWAAGHRAAATPGEARRKLVPGVADAE
jgi:hypothetical protein